MEKKPRENMYRTTVICVDSYTNGIPTGRIYNPYWPRGEAFLSLVQLLQKMESLLNTMRFPQAFTVNREFSPVDTRMSRAPCGEEAQDGELATFALRVLFRQNASWQGSVTWLEGRAEESFRSVLELILLMDSALSATPSPPDRNDRTGKE